MEHFKSIKEQMVKKDENIATAFILKNTSGAYQISKLSAAVLVRGQHLFQSRRKIIIPDSKKMFLTHFRAMFNFLTPEDVREPLFFRRFMGVKKWNIALDGLKNTRKKIRYKLAKLSKRTTVFGDMLHSK